MLSGVMVLTRMVALSSVELTLFAGACACAGQQSQNRQSGADAARKRGYSQPEGRHRIHAAAQVPSLYLVDLDLKSRCMQHFNSQVQDFNHAMQLAS